ncbi:MAG: hypothetical protein RIM72_14385 [Alphaproteobacteria bacterium]
MSLDARRLANWNYAACHPDSDPSAFGPFEKIIGLWRSKRRNGAALPRRKDFDFFDFKGWWGRVSIARIEPDPFDIRFVLWGTRLTEWWGVDYTNKRLGEMSITPDVWQVLESKYFRAMAEEPFIGLVSGSLDQHARPFIRVVGVDLPMSDGETVSHVLSAYVEAKQTDTITSVMPDAPIDHTF